MFLAASSDACAKTLYLKPNSNWKIDNARFAVYAFGSGETWYSMTAVPDNAGYYQATVDDKYPQVIFCRMNPAKSENNWNGDTKWNQTQDMTVTAGKDLCLITEGTWDNNGTWSIYGDEETGVDPDPITPSDYASAVPNQCTDVMLQAFYWNSDKDNTYGTSKWTALQSQASEINQYFQLVWLAPSCYSRTNSMGYLPKQYSKQKNSMGNEEELKALIGALHAGGTRVVADVVINHASNLSGWVNFFEMDFGEYGKFSPQSSWITHNDEASTEEGGKYASQLGPNNDDGQNGNDANYPAARDWDHMNAGVQEMCKAYLKFLKNTIGYDGFRFDYAGGYHVSHTRDYLAASKPYFSVMEYWNGDPNHLKARIDDASKSTLTFDFAAYYTALRDGIAKNNYDKCKSAGLRGKGYSKYAVHFVDNHDTFNRNGQYDSPDVGGSKDGYTTLHNRALMLQCNAYILSMPGVPCVFWPHWYTYKAEIKKMIEARKKAAIHSESTIEETSGSGWYKATVHGKAGNVILYLGSAASEAAPSGYKTAIKEDKVAMYYTGEGWEDVEQVIVAPKSEKFLKDGQLYIRRGEKIYDAQGRIVK